ncbi:MAG TPA: hypothetical protein VEJ63_12655 [Planctomycetota bacterium]|nr:hypothetical protein [Planctomycetota bacterium]
MTLEWFRTHKKFVYMILTPLIIVSFALVFPTGGQDKEHLAALGPSVQITINDNKKVVIPNSQVIKLRMELSKLAMDNEVGTDQAAAHLAKHLNAAALGFEAGEKELEQQMIYAIKQQVNQRERPDGEIKATREIYDKLLQNMQLSASQFERLMHELVVAAKFESTASLSENTAALALVNDAKVFANFCREKEVVRVRFKTLKSEDFMEKAEAPSAEKIKDFYDKNKGEDKREDFESILMTEPKLSADVLFYNTEKLFAEIKPSDEDLKRYYDQKKPIFWRKDPPKPNEPPHPAGEEFKPLDSVKAEVEQKWAEEERRTRASTRMNVLKTELEQAEKKHKEDEEKKPEAERKPFDMAAWAKTKELTHWATPEQTEDVYKNGKKEVNAPDAGWVFERFMLAKMSADPRYERVYAKMREEFSYPQPAVDNKPESGYVMTRIKNYVKPQLKSLDEAKAKIAEHLKIENAIELAKKEAEKLREDWLAGKNLPPIETLDEAKGDSKDQHALIRRFFSAPAAIGEILPVAYGLAEKKNPTDPKEEVLHERLYVGFAVERQTPTLTTFEKDTAFDRDMARRKVASAEFSYLNSAFDKFIYGKGQFDRTIPQPRLRDSYRERE